MDERLRKVVLRLEGRKKLQSVTCTFCRNNEGHNLVRLDGGWLYLCECCKKELESTNMVVPPS
jgi:hypothetical protein